MNELLARNPYSTKMTRVQIERTTLCDLSCYDPLVSEAESSNSLWDNLRAIMTPNPEEGLCMGMEEASTFVSPWGTVMVIESMVLGILFESNCFTGKLVSCSHPFEFKISL